jgi:hypothetical protein
MYAMFIWILFSKIFGTWIQDSRATRYVSLMDYFLNYLKDKERRFKADLALSLILRFKLRLGGYSIWCAILSHPI